MAKIRKIFGSAAPLNFNSKEQEFGLYWDSFKKSKLGNVYDKIPWGELVREFGLKEHHKGRIPIFSPQGKIALQFLKSYTGLSDNMLLERINADYQFQFFCGVEVNVADPLGNFKLLSEIRTGLGLKLDIQKVQKVLVGAWEGYMANTGTMLEDATCYETHMRYPTDAKLLWEANEWVYKQIKIFIKEMKKRMPRSKFGEQKSSQLNFSKKKRKTRKQIRRRIKSLLYLLGKLLGQLSEVGQMLPERTELGEVYQRRLSAITMVLDQQQRLYDGEKVEGRIVSIDKAYVRPIIRGKETKRVEFGPKANLVQVDGINFIEHLSFNAFNEGIRLISSVELVEGLFGNKVEKLAGDNIYANNANRSYCTQNGITTSFVRKGRPSKEEETLKQTRRELGVERATKMEGAFGTQKNHYNLGRIKARTEKNEILWVFFGIHMANAVEISNRERRPGTEKDKLAA